MGRADAMSDGDRCPHCGGKTHDEPSVLGPPGSTIKVCTDSDEIVEDCPRSRERRVGPVDRRNTAGSPSYAETLAAYTDLAQAHQHIEELEATVERLEARLATTEDSECAYTGAGCPFAPADDLIDAPESPPVDTERNRDGGGMNKLYYGDNLSIMEGMAKYSVDLVYLDPPFKSQQNYNLLYKTLTGKLVPEQAEAFCDTWEMDAEKDRIARNMPVLMKQYGVEQYYVDFWRLWMQALRNTQPHLLAYLIYMVQRLLHMKVILKPTGSIYLHCDPAASHYIKVMMDGIFGHTNFRSEIIWKRTSAHSGAKRPGPVHDVILFYTMGDKYVWNPQYQPYDESYIKSHFGNVAENGDRYYAGDLTGPGVRDGASGQPWREFNPTERGRHWQHASYLYDKYQEVTGKDLADFPFAERLDALDRAGLIYWPKKKGGWPRYKQFLKDREGVPIQDIWTDISPINSQSKKRLGYPTQKPMALLDRIVRASSNEGDVVFDPFCGCGTTIYAAQEAGRRWIGCDVAILAVRLVEGQLLERYGLVEGEHYEEHGIPNSVASAQALFEHDPFQFEHWAVEYVGGFPTKKTGDKGIDGRIYFETKDELGVMVLSVKGGNVRPTDIRDLIGVQTVEEGCELAGFISNKEPSKAMKSAAAKAGQWEYEGVQYDRVQLLTVKDIVEDKKRFHTPTKIGTKWSRP